MEQLVEREQFLEELATAFTEVTAGKGQFVLVSGEAGIGKTSLVESFAETHQKQARLLWGACDALFTPRSPLLLYLHCSQAQSKFPTLLEDEVSRVLILAAILEEIDVSILFPFLLLKALFMPDGVRLYLPNPWVFRVTQIKVNVAATY